MKQTLIALTLTAAHLLCGGSATFAQTAREARGTISAIGGRSLTVKVGAQDMKFTVDEHTTVIARGAGTKATRAVAAGKPVHISARYCRPASRSSSRTRTCRVRFTRPKSNRCPQPRPFRPARTEP